MEAIERVDELFAHQRAVREFADRDVPDALVEAVITAGTHAPSGSNTQPWRFIVVRDPAVREALGALYEDAVREAYGDSVPARGADRSAWAAVPVLIVACVQVPATGRAGIQTGASIYPACQNIMLRARSLGLGSVLTTLHRRRRDRAHEILGIPEGWDSAAIIPLGWPTRSYGPNRRRPVREVMMADRWDASRA